MRPRSLGARLGALVASADTAVPIPDPWPQIAAAVSAVPPIRMQGRLFQDIKARLAALAWRDGRAG